MKVLSNVQLAAVNTSLFMLIILLLLAGCSSGGGVLGPEVLALMQVEEDEEKVVCFKTSVHSPIPGSSSQAQLSILALPRKSEMTPDEIISAMNACF